MRVRSPLTGTFNTKLMSTIKADEIVRAYQDQMSVSVEQYFGKIKDISIYQCNDSGYKFYFPNTVVGDSIFYTKLESNSWYYEDWKWEHEVALQHLFPKNKILEIGCGEGAFLRHLVKSGFSSVYGLDLNEHAVHEAQKENLSVNLESVEKHSQKHGADYDCICLFQILEHVPNVSEFLKSCIHLLNKNGKLIVSVPNNQSFLLTSQPLLALNMPPHHQGLWDTTSLLSLQRYFPIRATHLYYEPLSSQHNGFGIRYVRDKVDLKVKLKVGRLHSLLKPIWYPFIDYAASLLTPYIQGHSVMVVYEKCD